MRYNVKLQKNKSVVSQSIFFFFLMKYSYPEVNKKFWTSPESILYHLLHKYIYCKSQKIHSQHIFSSGK